MALESSRFRLALAELVLLPVHYQNHLYYRDSNETFTTSQLLTHGCLIANQAVGMQHVAHTVLSHAQGSQGGRWAEPRGASDACDTVTPMRSLKCSAVSHFLPNNEKGASNKKRDLDYSKRSSLRAGKETFPESHLTIYPASQTPGISVPPALPAISVSCQRPTSQPTNPLPDPLSHHAYVHIFAPLVSSSADNASTWHHQLVIHHCSHHSHPHLHLHNRFASITNSSTWSFRLTLDLPHHSGCSRKSHSSPPPSCARSIGSLIDTRVACTHNVCGIPRP